MSLKTLYDNFAVSPWLDDLSRELTETNKLTDHVTTGVRGITSNPTIFAAALAGTEKYTASIQKLIDEGKDHEAIYWQLAVEDVTKAADTLRPVYDASNGTDGYVSLEVSPKHAHDTAGTLAQARELWQAVNRQNLMIKVPATLEGLPAITTLISEGVNVNVTLIFSLARYLAVINAYTSGLEQNTGDITRIHSVASFFVSRVDTTIDPLLNDHADLRGKAAVAQAQAAYGIFLESFNPIGIRWQALTERGANIQRPLWASTSVKNPEYDPLLYVSSLLGRDTVNTMPGNTVELVTTADQSAWHAITQEDILASHEFLSRLEAAGIKLVDITDKLETEGVEKFAKSFEELLETVKNNTVAA